MPRRDLTAAGTERREGLADGSLPAAVQRMMGAVALLGGASDAQWERLSVLFGLQAPATPRARPHSHTATAYADRSRVPDGERDGLVVRALLLENTGADFLDHLLSGASDVQLEHAFLVLGRVSLLQPKNAASWLERALTSDLSRRAGFAFDAALTLGELTVQRAWSQALAQALAGVQSLELAQSWQARLPEQPHALQEIEAWTLSVLRSAAESDERRACYAMQHCRVLGQLGRSGAALAAAAEGVECYRVLATTQPARFLPELALTLNTLGILQGRQGHAQAALAATAEATRVYRQLAGFEPEKYLPELAMALDNLGSDYLREGHLERALTATLEAVELYRGLAEARAQTFLSGLALSLCNLGCGYSASGRSTEALAATVEAVACFRQLVAAQPRAFLPDLAAALTNLGNLYHVCGRAQAAVSALVESIDLYRGLCADSDVYLSSLAVVFANLGEMSVRSEARLHVVERSVEVYRELAEHRPAAIAWLSSALAELGFCYHELGRRELAMEKMAEAVVHLRRLARDEPETFQSGLAAALDNLGNSYCELGRYQDALAVLEEAVALDRQGMSVDANASAPPLASALNNLGNVYAALERHEDALRVARETVAIRRQLAAAQPEVFLSRLASALSNLGNRYSAIGRLPQALLATEEAVSILRRLAPPEIDLQELGSTLGNLAILHAQLLNKDKALHAAQEAVQIRRQQVARQPEACQPSLAASLAVLAMVLRLNGRIATALVAARESESIFAPLAQRWPEAFGEQWSHARQLVSTLRVESTQN